MKAILFTTALLFLASLTFAQGMLQFKEKNIELKKLKADDSPTEVIFKFKNTGNEPVILTRVSPITTELKADWDKAPLAPGKSSEIKISFNTTRMPEKFNYSIIVFTSTNTREQLTLSANIIDNPAKPELLYNADMEGLKFKTTNIQFNNIYNWQVVSDTLSFFNARKDTVSVGTNYLPSYMQFAANPQKVAPGKKGSIIITYDAPKKNDYGYSYESIILSLNNSKEYKNRLTITANITEDFSKLNKKDLENAPIASFEKTEINFGDIKPGDKANCDFTLKNTGKSDLFIRKTRASCGCTAVTMGQTTVAPGQTTVIRATFDSANKSGHQDKSITVITNDPKNPDQTLRINGNIK